MSNYRLNGSLFEKMIQNGYHNLLLHEDELNKLNVFPVADGDTGTNLVLTLQKGIENGKSSIYIGEYLTSFNQGMLFGARGNSGAIFSQLFNGIANHLKSCESASIRDMRNAFIKGYKKAYSAVVSPREGTILTVAREAIENTKDHFDRNTTIESFFAIYLSEMKKSLENTPLLLPILKERGVVDSGAKGYVYVIEGMLKYLYGEIVELPVVQSIEDSANEEMDLSSFGENSDFSLGYCMEFILQRLKDSKYDQNFKVSRYVKALKSYGNSIVCFEDNSRVKIHIHTLKPARVIALSQEYGEFVTFKLENMQLQAESQSIQVPYLINDQNLLNKDFSIMMFTDGVETDELFTELGVSIIFHTKGFTQARSSVIKEAISKVTTDKLLIICNNPLIYNKVMGLINNYPSLDIKVVNTLSIASGYHVLAITDLVNDDFNKCYIDLCESLDSTISIQIEENYDDTGIWKSLVNNNFDQVSDDAFKLVVNTLKNIPNILDYESAIVFSSDESLNSNLEKVVNACFPSLEINFMKMSDSSSLFVIGLI